MRKETAPDPQSAERAEKIGVSADRCARIVKTFLAMARRKSGETVPVDINELIERAGITGEENNRLLLFVVASSFAMPNTLHALIQGASGSGKTRLLRVVSELIPEEAVKRLYIIHI